MGKKGGSRHLKRLAAPITYHIPKKTWKWAIRVSPGPHPADRAIPIGILIRDVFGLASNLREVKYMLRKEYIKIDGKPVKDYHYPVGLMDVIELVPEEKFYRILPHKISLIYPYEIINDSERHIKPLRIKRKTMVKGERIQLTTHDGRNFVLNKESEYYSLKPGDTLIYNFSDNTFVEYIEFKPGSVAVIIGGSRIGRKGKVIEISKPHPLKPRVVKLESNGTLFETIFDYVFIVGKDKPVISLGGGEK